MLTCQSCGHHFNEKAGYNSHVSGCKKDVEVTCPNSSFTVSRNADGNFVCLCAYAECSRSFSTDNGLAKHLHTAACDWQLVS